MECGEARLLLTAKVDGEATPGRETALAAHLSGCGACRRELADLRRLALRTDAAAAAAGRPGDSEIFDALRRRILARIAEAPPVRRIGRFPGDLA